MRLEPPSHGLMLLNCEHCLHKGCLEDMFRLKKSKCPACQASIAHGFDKAINVQKVSKRAPNKKKNTEEVKKVLQEIQERVQPVEFGIEGIGVSGSGTDGTMHMDARQLYNQRGHQQAAFKIRHSKHHPPRPPKDMPSIPSGNEFNLNFNLNGRKIMQLDENLPEGNARGVFQGTGGGK